MIKTYHKLVRDRIPEIIESTGNRCTTQILSEADYIKMLECKLNEELQEYQESKNLEELADLLEVMRALVEAKGYCWDDLERIRKEKAKKRGGFSQRILLKEVTEIT